MIFTYEVNVLCSKNAFNSERCAILVTGEVATTPEEGRKNAMAEARQAGWFELGDDVWCPSCAALRLQGEAIRQARQGRFCPVTGMKLRYAFPKAGAIGHQSVAAMNLKEGAVYTVAKVLPLSTALMVYLEEVPTLCFNVELFEEVKP